MCTVYESTGKRTVSVSVYLNENGNGINFEINGKNGNGCPIFIPFIRLSAASPASPYPHVFNV